MLRNVFRYRAALCVALALSSCASPKGIPDRVGVYIWGALPNGGDPLHAAIEDAKSLGAHVVRTAIGPYWDPRPDADPLATLDCKVRRPDYQEILKSFPVVILTAYDLASYDPATKAPRYRNPNTPASPEMLAGVREEYRRFTTELAKNPGVFVISNWEAENDATDEQWPDYLRYLQARLDGIVSGRREVRIAGYPGRVMTAVEFTHVNAGYTYHLDPRPPRKACGLDAALALQGVDYLSYSAWESIFHTEDRSYTVSKLREAFAVIHEKCRVATNPCRVIVGEVGYLRNHDPDHWNLNMILTESLNAGAAYVINWVEYDQPGQSDPYRFGIDLSQFGDFDIGRRITPQGKFLQLYLAGRQNSWPQQVKERR